MHAPLIIVDQILAASEPTARLHVHTMEEAQNLLKVLA